MKKLRLLFLLLGCGMLFACKPSGEPTDGTELPEVKRDFDAMTDWFAVAIRKTHPYLQTVWNADADVAEFNLLLVSEDRNRICAITTSGKKEWRESEWPDEIKTQVNQMNSFAFALSGGKYYTLILCSFSDFDRMVEAAKQQGQTLTDKDMAFMWLGLFYHETFHAYVQRADKGWMKGSGEAYNRDQEYPIDYSPRIYRKLALFALKNAWEDESKKAESYARAKYWTDKYEKKYAEEAAAIKSTDIDEATAEYFSRIILHSAFPEYELLYDIDTYNLGRGVDAESYMSSVAIQLLRREGRLNEGIAAFKSQSMTPINCLLKDIPVPANYDEKQDEADIERIRQAIDKIMGDDSPTIAPVKALLQSHKEGNNTYIALREDNGAYTSSQGTFTLTELPGFSCMVNYAVTCVNYEIKTVTILKHLDYNIVSLADKSHLQLTNEQEAVDAISPVPGVNISRIAQLSGLNGENAISMKTLPTEVLIGKDSFGNTYYICEFFQADH